MGGSVLSLFRNTATERLIPRKNKNIELNQCSLGGSWFNEGEQEDCFSLGDVHTMFTLGNVG